MSTIYRASVVLSEVRLDSAENSYNLASQIVSPAQLAESGVKEPSALTIYGASHLKAGYHRLFLLARPAEGGFIYQFVSQADAELICADLGLTLTEVPIAPLRERDPELTAKSRSRRRMTMTTAIAASTPAETTVSDPATAM